MSFDDDVSPQLTWTDAGEPRSGRFGDVYFSRDDGLAESRAVFLDGCGLPQAWSGRRVFTVAELGFGTGLNIAALLDLWRREGPADGRLHVFTVEGFPLKADEARRALNAWPALRPVVEPLLAAWPGGTPGFHRIDLPEFRAVIDVAVGEVGWALEQWSGTADAWFLDGFSPALNPAMWSGQVLDGVAARSAPDARVATFTVAGAVRRGLAERGFTVEKKPGHGRKRERLEARREGSPPCQPWPRVVVIGAGVAGAATARALKATGLAPVVIEAVQPGAGGSGFPSGLVTPRIDAGDAVIAGFYAQALERAGQLYDAVPGAVLAQGVLQAPQTARDGPRFEKIARQPLWRPGAMTVIDAHAAADWLGEPASEGGLMMADARVVRPAAVLEAWLKDVEVIKAEAAGLQRDDAEWIVRDAAGAEIARAHAVVVAAGWGSAALLSRGGGLSPVRGQADWTTGPATAAAAWGGYAAPTGDGILFGATHDRGDTTLDARDADTTRNLDTLRLRLPQRAAQAEAGLQGRRVAVRATTRDRLPLAGRTEYGVYVLSGLGSRGLCVAPLLGEHLAALIAGRPSPLPAAYSGRVDPNRS